MFPPDVWAPGTFELTAANGDKLLGSIHASLAPDVGMGIREGTGRFLGVVGSYRALITDFTSASLPATVTGGISSVGSNKK